ncbi:type I-B CRISPR-associated protein Cas5b [Spirosoma endbachense]|uniref:Type I-B CRISPR-associated protein Cas5 n=1 Tax=Spirosoma endbachense TaxID=2666025 RepID=A0A6P1VY58_9BACT|nr:type I-B CRISPR-associated protein Cas5b [Spirosoma endbachense]QHV96649.1 type I-B CRISPR-associated protein Cas5 [Spirosoma endbachense]
MANQKLISFDLRADFGFFKKPDYNDGLLLSYNILHKPALLGILGAIIGLKGYSKKGEFPEYYLRLKDLPIGIQPLDHEKGNFQKTSVKYTNTVGYANDDGNLLIEEMMLIQPAYRCYLLLDLENPDHSKLYEYLKNGQAEYIPYLGKNEFQAWWLMEDDGRVSLIEYTHESFLPGQDFLLNTLFIKSKPLKDEQVTVKISFRNRTVSNKATFSYFERLPVHFHETLVQYQLYDFAYTDFTLSQESTITNLFQIEDEQGTKTVVQLF